VGEIANGAKPLILVVDDIFEIGQAVMMALESEGYEVETALDAPEALMIAARRLPDLVVCDVNLPSMLGWELCGKLKSLALPKALPVIMLTAKTAEVDEMRSYEMSADDHFTKPPNFELLLAAVARHLAANGRL
jgi:DNA-binding response OmpR family regulator